MYTNCIQDFCCIHYCIQYSRLLCYVHEIYRCVGWLIRFVHNRVENIVKAMVRQQMVLSAPLESLADLATNLADIGVNLPTRSALVLAREVVNQKGALSGEFEVDVRESRRNTKLLVGDGLDTNLKDTIRQACLRFGNAVFDVGVKKITKGKVCDCMVVCT